ncbi:MAG: UbiA family prenyltransferase [Bacteriovoracaceae bacterium]|nr:UbiA family prenyltransferase [Bacteriovoracaceae bacterium]
MALSIIENSMEGLRPLCVDLDNSFIKSDLSVDAIIYLIKNRPSTILKLFILLFKSRSLLKNYLAGQYTPDVKTLPINQSLKTYILQEKDKGRKIVLITGSPQNWAEQIANEYQCFDEVIGTEGNINLVGIKKTEILVERFGMNQFDYVGDSFVDRRVWEKSAMKILAFPWPLSLFKDQFDLKIFEKKSLSTIIFRMLRSHQWVKNFLLFVPLLTAHLFSLEKWGIATLAFVSFCLCASSGYIINDILDIHSDRKHPKKKYRPIASGDIPIPYALGIFVFLLGSSFLIASQLKPLFSFGLSVYFILSLLYSFKLKNILLLDTFVLAGLYTLRLYCGGIVVSVVESSWLHIFSAFFFLALAFLKRFIELKSFVGGEDDRLPGRSYHKQDMVTIFALGICSSFASVIVFSLYIYQDSTRALYSYPEILWVVCFLLLMWINRIWIFAQRNILDHDPISFAIKDKVSWLILFLVSLTLMLAKYL